MGIGYNPKVVSGDLVLYLDAANPKSYSGTGNNWNSITSNLTALKYGSQSPTYPQWNANGYFTFSGGVTANNYSRFQVQNIPSFSALSVFAWSRAIPSTFITVLRMNNSDFEISYDVNSRFYVAAGTNYNDIGVYTTESTVLDGKWHQLGFTFDGQNLIAYYDGVRRSTQTRGTVTTTAAGLLMIGTRDDAYASHFEGDIGVVTIHSKVLNDDEIRQNFNALRGRYGI